MKSLINLRKETRIACFPSFSLLKKTAIIALCALAIQTPTFAQETEYKSPSWWFGVGAGANANFYRGSSQHLNASLTTPAAFHNGNGFGLFVAPVIEYHRENTMLGFMLEFGYDNRSGSSDEIKTPCNCPADLESNISYLTIEPNLRFAPFKSDFYLYAGPRFAFNLDKDFEYQLGINPAYPNQAPTAAVKGDYSHMNKSVISFQVGAGYDIHLSDKSRNSEFLLSPFISYHPYYGQDPRSIETMTISTLRVGAALKFGYSSDKAQPVKEEKNGEEEKLAKGKDAIAVVPVIIGDTSKIRFNVYSPENIVSERRVRETFPLRNYIYYDLNSTAIPKRYVQLTKDEVAAFKYEQLEVYTPKRLTGRADREMVVYHNILNILGDRMNRFPATTIVLVGSSEKGPDDAELMAKSTKKYLVDIFGVNEFRIKIEGRYKPKLPNEQPNATKELATLREGDRRVAIESSSPSLLMEFQSGELTPLKPVVIDGVEVAPVESYVSFTVTDDDNQLQSWRAIATDKTGKEQHFGPYTLKEVSVPGKTILGTNKDGIYKITMIGETKNEKTVTQYATINVVLWTPPVDEQMMRFSIIYEFNNAKAIDIYADYLNKVVVPQIPKNSKVIIHGHTDKTGSAVNNKALSLARANDVKRIMEQSLRNDNRNDVTFEVYGFGEDENNSPFLNNLPEERAYNRSVIIDIIPRK